MTKNNRLKAMGAALMEEAEALFDETGEKQRLFRAFNCRGRNVEQGTLGYNESRILFA